MIYLNEKQIQNLMPNWAQNIEVIERAIHSMGKGDYVQPIKPYLRYRNPNNRIIAMPAFLGGEFNVAGIKWISSFSENIGRGLPRAHSTLILNEADTGKPIAVINSGLLSGIRTAAVSGWMIKRFISAFPIQNYRVGIIGLGPIGQLHVQMISQILNDKLEEIKVHDVKLKEIPNLLLSTVPIRYFKNWEDIYRESDIFITCTTSPNRYIEYAPPKGSLILNVSLRDFFPNIVKECPYNIVDNWDEVCRENTDIEIAHKDCGLESKDVKSLIDVCEGNYFQHIDPIQFRKHGYMMFHPMGMAIFDLAIAKQFLDLAVQNVVGFDLEGTNSFV